MNLNEQTSILALWADALDDLERVRIAAGNRADAIHRLGKGDEIATFQEDLADELEKQEKRIENQLRRAMRKHPLGQWAEKTPGVGLKQVARLLKEIGDPTIGFDAEGEPFDRGVRQLWAFCGLHVVEGHRPKRKRGQQSNWSNNAKMRAILIAESCIKQVGSESSARSPYRDIYERERLKWEPRNVSDLHKHRHALSIVAKEMLKGLWREARRLRGLTIWDGGNRAGRAHNHHASHAAIGAPKNVATARTVPARP